MRNRRAILFFLGWALIFALTLMLLSRGGHLSEKAAPSDRTRLNVEAVSSLDIKRSLASDGGRAERIRIAREAGKWRIETPLVAEADMAAVKRIVDAVVFAEPVDELTESDMASLGRTLRDFGLASPRVSVELQSDGQREVFDFGRNTPSGQEVYVRREGKGGIFTVPVNVVQELTRPFGELRRRRLFTFGRMDVSMIGLKNVGGKLSKLVKEGGGWRLTEPMEAPADRVVVDELVDALCSASVIDYASEGSNLAPGLGDNEGYTISLRDSFGAVERIVLGASAGTNTIWALTSEQAVVHVNAGLLAFCRKRQRILEDTRVFPVEMPSVVSFSVTEGFPAYMLSRVDAAAPWRLVSPVDAPADMAAVTNLLSRILSLRGIDLSPEGEEGRITFSLSTSTTNFPSRSASQRFLREGVRLADLRDKVLLRYPRAAVKRIRVDTAAGAGWEATKAEPMLDGLEKGIVAERVETVVVRPDEFDRCGFGHPSYTIAFELDDKDSALRKLLLGAAAPGGGRFAMMGGADAVFVLSASTVSTLTKPVEETLVEVKKK